MPSGSMSRSFHITAHTPIGPLTVIRSTAQEAMAKAVELHDEGVKVVIKDFQGVEYTLETFVSTFLTPERGAPGRGGPG